VKYNYVNISTTYCIFGYWVGRFLVTFRFMQLGGGSVIKKIGIRTGLQTRWLLLVWPDGLWAYVANLNMCWIKKTYPNNELECTS